MWRVGGDGDLVGVTASGQSRQAWRDLAGREPKEYTPTPTLSVLLLPLPIANPSLNPEGTAPGKSI